MKALFCQISDKFFNKTNTLSDKYYTNFYRKYDYLGYYKPEHFWEIPLWIAEVGYLFDEKELHIVTDIEESIKYINKCDSDIILFSVLSINKEIINNICISIDKPIYVGGYTKLNNPNVVEVESVMELCSKLNIKYEKGYDYSLFRGIKTIPRLQLSKGCKHLCYFCTIDRVLKENDMYIIDQQINAFKDLDFKLIYIDDKTFGQATNYDYLYPLYTLIQRYNSEFKGFIVQTTATQLKRIHKDIIDLHIKVIELGVESYNDNVLTQINKPHKTEHINWAIEFCKFNNIKVIYNIINGLPNETWETYKNTLKFIKFTKPFSINYYNLALYEGTKISRDLKSIDDNETSLVKEYNTNERNKMNTWFYRAIFKYLKRSILYD